MREELFLQDQAAIKKALEFTSEAISSGLIRPEETSVETAQAVADFYKTLVSNLTGNPGD